MQIQWGSSRFPTEQLRVYEDAGGPALNATRQLRLVLAEDVIADEIRIQRARRHARSIRAVN